LGAACTLRKTNSQPASMMQSTLAHPTNITVAQSQYTRMASDPQAKTSAAVGRGQKTVSSGVEKVKGQELKGQRSGSAHQSKRTIFSGLRSSLSRLSKSPSHEDLVHETSVTTDVNTTNDTIATTAAATAAVGVNGESDRLGATDTSSAEQDVDADQHPHPTEQSTCTTDCALVDVPGNYLLVLMSSSLFRDYFNCMPIPLATFLSPGPNFL